MTIWKENDRTKCLKDIVYQKESNETIITFRGKPTTEVKRVEAIVKTVDQEALIYPAKNTQIIFGGNPFVILGALNDAGIMSLDTYCAIQSQNPERG